MGARALQEEAKLGVGSFAANVTCAAEGDDTIMELKVVSDAIKGGIKTMFPGGLMWRTLLGHDPRWLRKRVLIIYIAKIIYALWLVTIDRKRLAVEGQLLKDIAWARAHLLLLDCFVSSVTKCIGEDSARKMRRGGEEEYRHACRWSGEMGSMACKKIALEALNAWIASYEKIMVKFPTPVQV